MAYIYLLFTEKVVVILVVLLDSYAEVAGIGACLSEFINCGVYLCSDGDVLYLRFGVLEE